MKKKVLYIEPADFFPEEIRKECKLGEFDDESDKNKKNEKENEEFRKHINS